MQGTVGTCRHVSYCLAVLVVSIDVTDTRDWLAFLVENVMEVHLFCRTLATIPADCGSFTNAQDRWHFVVTAEHGVALDCVLSIGLQYLEGFDSRDLQGITVIAVVHNRRATKAHAQLH